jgi:hypothetical protein
VGDVGLWARRLCGLSVGKHHRVSSNLFNNMLRTKQYLFQNTEFFFTRVLFPKAVLEMFVVYRLSSYNWQN